MIIWDIITDWDQTTFKSISIIQWIHFIVIILKATVGGANVGTLWSTHRAKPMNTTDLYLPICYATVVTQLTDRQCMAVYRFKLKLNMRNSPVFFFFFHFLFRFVGATYVCLLRHTTHLIGLFHLIQIPILNIITLFFSCSSPLKLCVETSAWDRTPEWQCTLSKPQAEEGNIKEGLWDEASLATLVMPTAFCAALYK